MSTNNDSNKPEIEETMSMPAQQDTDDKKPVETINYREALERAMEDAENNPNWGTARLTSKVFIEIRLKKTQAYFVFEHDSLEEIVLGRKDYRSGYTPDVDLGIYDGASQGVSRRHAVIKREETVLTLTDLSSRNGTFLNGQQLSPNQPRIVRNGDEVRLGYMVMTVSFNQTP